MRALVLGAETPAGGALAAALVGGRAGARRPGRGALAGPCRCAAREMAPAGGGVIVVALPAGAVADIGTLAAEHAPKGVRLLTVDVPAAPDDAWARGVLARLAWTRGARAC